MKATINRKTYDTETAKEIVSTTGGGYCNDFRYWEETLYKTKKGNYFLYGRGGALSKYSERCGDGMSGGSGIIPITKDEALNWCEENELQDAIEKEFSELIEEA